MRGNVKLIYTSSSPYARKVRACIRYYEWHNIIEEMLHPFENEIEVRKLNPLGKIPILQVDGQQIIDSETIITYLRSKLGNQYEPCLVELKCLSLCQGLMDATVNLRVECVRKLQSDWWTQRLKDSVRKTLDELQCSCTADLLSKSDGHLWISLVCVIQYLDFRHSDWLSTNEWSSLKSLTDSYGQSDCLKEIPFC